MFFGVSFIPPASLTNDLPSSLNFKPISAALLLKEKVNCAALLSLSVKNCAKLVCVYDCPLITLTGLIPDVALGAWRKVKLILYVLVST